MSLAALPVRASVAALMSSTVPDTSGEEINGEAVARMVVVLVPMSWPLL